jgi:ribosomal protein S18 acetylase RimI-like enzyme
VLLKDKRGLRTMVVADLPRVLAIEELSYATDPWSDNDFRIAMRCGFLSVAEIANAVVGYVVYAINPDNTRSLSSLTVDSAFRRQGIGRLLMDSVIKEACKQKARIIHHARETDLVSHLFLREMGFKATCVKRDYYPIVGDQDSEAAYIFVREP